MLTMTVWVAASAPSVQCGVAILVVGLWRARCSGGGACDEEEEQEEKRVGGEGRHLAAGALGALQRIRH